MLINFTVKNWMSFLYEATLSMLASSEHQHRERVPRVNKGKVKVLPIAAIYGGNASGKTNFFKALNFVQEFVVSGTKPDAQIFVDPYLLDEKVSQQPTYFCIELLIHETIYEYSFSVNKKEVIEEKLIQIKSTTETVLYHRTKGRSNLHKSLSKDDFLKFTFKGTRDNQLFLTNSVFQNVVRFKPIYDWFKSTLVMVAPDERFREFEHFFDQEHKLYTTMNTMLSKLDTGIVHLGGEQISLSNIPLPEQVKSKLLEDVKEGMTVRIDLGSQRLIVTRKNSELIVKKLFTYHAKSDGTEAKFEINQESDGSQRIIDLLPAFLEISSESSRKVYVIDEIDRSLHTHLTRKLLESYLDTCSIDTRAQLLITTHDVSLMDQSLLRRDEMWVAERHKDGYSKLYSFSEFKDIRYDKDIKKSYLQGRLGGVPRILLS